MNPEIEPPDLSHPALNAAQPDGITLTHDLHATHWRRLAEIMAAALTARDPATLARAHAASFACVYAWDNGKLVGSARAVSDGVLYATIYDVVVDPACQGKGVGRKLVQNLIDRLPVERIFLTSVPDKQGFYAKLGFLRQTNAMAWYASEARSNALARGILLDHDDVDSPRVLALST